MSQPPNTIHYTQLPPSLLSGERQLEWDTFRRELPRLIEEGNEGKWVLLAKDQVIGFYETQREAVDEACRRIYPDSYIVQLVATYQPMIRCPLWLYFACPTRVSP